MDLITRDMSRIDHVCVTVCSKRLSSIHSIRGSFMHRGIIKYGSDWRLTRRGKGLCVVLKRDWPRIVTYSEARLSVLVIDSVSGEKIPLNPIDLHFGA